MKVVLFKINQLGDNVAFVGAAQELRKRFPDWDLVVLTTPMAAELYQGKFAPWKLIAGTKSAFNKSYRRPWALAGWILEIRKLHPEACLVSFDQGTAAHLVARLSGARVRIGGETDRMPGMRSLTENVPLPEDGRAVTWNWRQAGALAEALGGAGWPADPAVPDLSHLLAHGPRPAGGRPRVVVHPGASGPSNQWGADRFAAVAAVLSRDFEVVWIRHGTETRPAPAGTVDAPVNSLSEFSAWSASAALFLGNNSGPMHLANALGCAGVVVTGSTALGWDPFWHRKRWTVLRPPPLHCVPFERLDAEPSACLNPDGLMDSINYWTVENVETACRERLAGASGTAP
jgi:ADP-heptose:LPS heptosyltransferase